MKNSKYCGSEYAPDPFFCIERLEKQIATLTADKRILKAAIEYYKDDVVVMKPLKWCANGCNKPPKPPSLVICEDCLDAISNKFQEMIDKLEMREKETNNER